MNRRYFLGTAVAAAAASRSVAAADKVNVAIIGVGGQGSGHAVRFASMPDVNVSYLCDVDQSHRERVGKMVEKTGAPPPKLVDDMRRALDDKSVNAVVIATPDHWHGPATILACDAGKDVYVEKPASHNLREGRLMVAAARRNKRIVQLGTQERSRPSTQRAIAYIKSGKIGKVLAAKPFDVQLRDDIGHKENGPVPPGVDYDTWVGPAPWIPFNENRFHYKWHWHWHFGTGDMGNDGAHQIDVARWALDVSYPTQASGFGRKVFFQDDQQTPDTQNITFDYKDKVMFWELRIWNPYKMEGGMDNAVEVYGSDGMVQIGRWRDSGKRGFKVFDRDRKLVLEDAPDDDDNHARNFIDCVRSRKLPNADIGIGHISCLHCQLGNIVARVNRTIRFDRETETVIDDPQANLYIKRRYRKHWATPKGV